MEQIEIFLHTHSVHTENRRYVIKFGQMQVVTSLWH